MKTARRRSLFVVSYFVAVGLAASSIAAEITRSRGDVDQAAPSTKPVQAETIRLIREDAKSGPVSLKPPAPESAQETVEGVQVLDRFVVRGEKEIPDFSPPRETSLEKFFRTGTISQHVGKKVTTRLWASGDAGLVLSFRW